MMWKQPACVLTALAAGLMMGTFARADDPAPQRGYSYFPSAKNTTAYRPRSVTQQPTQSTAAAKVQTAPVQSYVARSTTGTASAAPSVPYGYAVPSRPVSWGVRYGVGSGYPASLFGQVTAPPTAVQPVPAAGQPTVAQPMTPAYAQPNYGNGSMYQGTPNTPPVNGYSNIYAYAGRFYGPYYGYGPSYYSYGGMGGWGTPYNSGYYTSGCYTANACCRASARYCTPFGGAFRGCGCGCYIPTPPPCPTACYGVAPSGVVAPSPAPSTTPQTYDTPTTPSNAAPPSPQPPDAQEPVTPVEKKIVPAPQARNLPRIPNLPPDA